MSQADIDKLVSKLRFLSKVVEKVVDATLLKHINSYGMPYFCQLTYYTHHSTETAIVSIHDLNWLVYQGCVAALVLLDPSSASTLLTIQFTRKSWELTVMLLAGWLNFCKTTVNLLVLITQVW